MAAATLPAADETFTGVSVYVTNCDDNGPGSLRAAAATAQSGDIIDMTGLSCQRIGLTSGAITMAQKNLTLIGPGASKLLIDGNDASSILRHDWRPYRSPQSPLDGVLRLEGLSIAHGRLEADLPRGGCVFSHSSVVLHDVRVHHCVAQAAPTGFPAAQGGGIFASRDVTLRDSSVCSSSVLASQPESNGGGIAAFSGRLTLDHSLLCSNYSSGDDGGASAAGLTATSSTIRDNTAVGIVGGIFAFGSSSPDIGEVVIQKSTFSDNRADMFGAAGFAAGDVRIADSTFSGNHSTRGTSGLTVSGENHLVSIVNSTIVFNVSDGPFGDTCEGGLFITGLVHLQSTIVAENTCSGGPSDISSRALRFGDRIRGANNLINVSRPVVPADTISADPRLAPLSDNGGPTWTHGLLDDSPAIDRGNNAAGFAYDQRGPGFPREKGFATDIGAYEK